MSKLLTRPAILADMARITEIYTDAVLNGTASYEIDPPTQAVMTERFEVLVGQEYPYIVAEGSDGTLLGYAYASAFRPRHAYRFMAEDSIYVAPEAKGRGVGRLLLEALVEATQALGFRQMIAVIGDGRPDSPSVRLHERLGFHHSG
ncbi:MAG TPA: GNAT family N-acetyltransferase, partial [Mesorhizobium sp.]